MSFHTWNNQRFSSIKSSRIKWLIYLHCFQSFGHFKFLKFYRRQSRVNSPQARVHRPTLASHLRPKSRNSCLPCYGYYPTTKSIWLKEFGWTQFLDSGEHHDSRYAPLRKMCPNTESFLVSIFPHSDWIRRDTSHLSVFSPNAGKYGPEITPYLDTFHAVIHFKNKNNNQKYEENVLTSWSYRCVNLKLNYQGIIQPLCNSYQHMRSISLLLQVT